MTVKQALRKRNQWRRAAARAHQLNDELQKMLDTLNSKQFREYAEQCFPSTMRV